MAGNTDRRRTRRDTNRAVGARWGSAMVVDRRAIGTGIARNRCHGCSLDLADNTLRMGNMSCHCHRITEMPRAYKITMADTVIVPPMCDMLVPGRVEGGAHYTLGIVEERDYPLCHGNVAMSKMVINPDKPTFPFRLANMRSEPT